MKFVLLTFLIWRIVLFIPLYLGNLFLFPRSGFEFGGIDNFLFFPWANFDGVHYLTIASVGYTTEANFLPLLPILIRGLTPVFGNFLSGLLIANLSFLLGLIVLYKLILLDYTEKVAKQAVVFLLIFPTSFYFASIYTESLFLLLIVSSFYFARKGNWFISSVFSAFSSATRLVGILMLPALVYGYIKQEGTKISLKSLSLFLVPLGLISYAIFNFYKWGNAFYFISAHGNLANSRSVDSIILFPQTIFRYIKIFTDFNIGQFAWWIALLEIAVFFIITVLFYVAWKKKVRKEYLIFAFLAFLTPVLSGTFSSLPRYVLILFPIFIALALIKSSIIKIAYVVSTTLLLIVLLMYFSRGYFVA